jgi:signal transduction histidine kinase
MEAIQNAAKHSGASRVTVLLRRDGGRWRLDVTDDGAGFDQASALADVSGAGLMNMRDRLDAVGGSVAIASSAGSGTTVSAVGPAAPQGG